MGIDPKFLVYYFLIFLCSVAGMLRYREKRELRPLFVLLPVSLCTEVYVEYLIQQKRPYYFVYHVYEILDFLFFCLLFSRNLPGGRARLAPLALFTIYAAVAITLSLTRIPVSVYPSVQYSIESFFLILLSLFYLLTIPAESGKRIFEHNMFWICTGLLFVHAGILLVNGSYNYLKSLSSARALAIKDWVNMLFNYILYFSFLTATLWRTGSTRSLS
ncbi:hypothetical protein [Flaviaesturariibacter amylovorans]|uniref:Lysoplasmalogenase n=1 Tax=Flaviaesturariibacter amylovorans TaxID=1084520 RepID=A0ABP8HHG6_9BACT